MPIQLGIRSLDRERFVAQCLKFIPAKDISITNNSENHMSEQSVKNHANLIWNIAETLRGTYKAGDYGKVVLPFVVLRRLDSVLEATRDQVVKIHADKVAEGYDEEDMAVWMDGLTPLPVYNTYPENLTQIAQKSPAQIKDSLIAYVMAFDPAVRDIFHEKFEFDKVINKLHSAKLLYEVLKQFVATDLHTETVSNEDMGAIFEELLRRFSEMSNETAGEHYTPRDALHLLADLIIVGDEEFKKQGIVRLAYDPTAGTGGILSVLQERAKLHNPSAQVRLYGQELNAESFAICKSDLLLKGQDAENIKHGNTLTDDQLAGVSMHWVGSNPPYGVEWKAYADVIREEHERLGVTGRFGAGLPRVSDGQLLFVQHIVSKLRHGGRAGIVTNGSPLFTGGAGSGESEVRRWLIEKDYLDAIVALPTDMFYNTGIQTYIWIIDNDKPEHRKGKVQLIDASGDAFYKPMRKALGSKRRELTEEGRQRVVDAYLAMEESDISKVFDGTDFGFREIRVERPLRLKFDITEDGLNRFVKTKTFEKLSHLERAKVADLLFGEVAGQSFTSRDNFLTVMEQAFERVEEKTKKTPGKTVGAETLAEGLSLSAERFSDNLLNLFGVRKKTVFLKDAISIFGETDPDAEICFDSKGNSEPDARLRDHEMVPLEENWLAYFKREIEPFASDAWVDESYTDLKNHEIGRVGYEINFNRYFYQYVQPRPLAEIDNELKLLELEISGLLKEVVA